MKNKNELNYKDLKMTCDKSLFNFNETTQEAENITTGIGQERGIKALEFGLQVNVKGYNIYIEGPSGVGKTMYTKNYLNKIKYILIIFSMAVSVGISILGNGFLSTIPWIIIIPFVLGLLYKENTLIIATALIFNILFNIVLQSAYAIIFDSIYILLCTGVL